MSKIEKTIKNKKETFKYYEEPQKGYRKQMRSMCVNKDDHNAIRWGRNKTVGSCVQGEFKQHNPMFFTREMANLNLVGQYRGASAFLIASGPSFNKCDKSLLKKPGVWSMTTNNAVRSHRGQAACIVDDPCRFIKSLWLDPSIQKFVPDSAFEKPLWDNEAWQPLGINVGDCPNVVGFRRNSKFVPWRFMYEDTVNWGCDEKWGGCRSVFLASIRILYEIGFRNVYLVGADFNMSEDYGYHFDEGRDKGAVNCNNNTYAAMIEWFEELQPYFLAENFIVKNCNPESALTAFPFISLEDAVAEATCLIGDTENERTRGMYKTYEEKITALKAENGETVITPAQLKGNMGIDKNAGPIVHRTANDIDKPEVPAQIKINLKDIKLG